MKNGLLICSGSDVRKNIGDYIQSIAQEQFIGKDYQYVERESLNTFKSDEKVNLIMNSWFMWHPENFPPSDDINPLFISFHINPSIASKLLTEKSIAYLKKYQPIGCRDTDTMRLLQSNGIDSYFSGCLTLTLGISYKTPQKDGSIYFVDPYYEFCAGGGNFSRFYRLKNYLRALYHSFKTRRVVSKFYNNFSCEFHTKLYKISARLDRFVLASCFYEAYRIHFSDDVFLQAKFISHMVVQSNFKDDDEKMNYARLLINKYARAQLIVTSRIHCALPALSVETPVVFVTSEKLRGGSIRGAGRFGGLIDLMHVMEWTKCGLKIKTPELKRILHNGKINKSTDVGAKTEYRKLSEMMEERVRGFLSANL